MAESKAADEKPSDKRSRGDWGDEDDVSTFKSLKTVCEEAMSGSAVAEETVGTAANGSPVNNETHAFEVASATAVSGTALAATDMMGSMQSLVCSPFSPAKAIVPTPSSGGSTPVVAVTATVTATNSEHSTDSTESTSTMPPPTEDTAKTKKPATGSVMYGPCRMPQTTVTTQPKVVTQMHNGEKSRSQSKSQSTDSPMSAPKIVEHTDSEVESKVETDSMTSASKPTLTEISTDTEIRTESKTGTKVDVKAQPSDNVVQWTVAEVVHWLSTVCSGQFASLAPSFEENEVDGADLVIITKDVLKDDLGIKKMSARRNLQAQIDALVRPPLTESTTEKVTKRSRSQMAATDSSVLKKSVPVAASAEVVGDSGSVPPHRRATGIFLDRATAASSSSVSFGAATAQPKAATERIGIERVVPWDNSDKGLDAMQIVVGDTLHFQWMYTKDVWQFTRADHILRRQFNRGNRIAGIGKRSCKWTATKPGTFYFVCSVGLCYDVGNMCLKVNVLSVAEMELHRAAKKRRLR